jgi:hypothetical protein
MSSTATIKSPNNFKTKTTAASKKFDLQDAVACEFSFEKCKGGFRITCGCDDSLECADMQGLCAAICERNCSICCVRDGIEICNFNLSCCQCLCDNTKDGCCISCCNNKCCDMLQAICDCLQCCCENSCCCYVCFGDKCCCFGGCSA